MLTLSTDFLVKDWYLYTLSVGHKNIEISMMTSFGDVIKMVAIIGESGHVWDVIVTKFETTDTKTN